MKVYIVADDQGAKHACIQVGDAGYLLRIGSETEVDAATPEALSSMVQSALAIAVYDGLQAHRATKH